METDSNILAWRMPYAEEPGWLQSKGSQKTGHDLVIKPPPGGSLVKRKQHIFKILSVWRHSVGSFCISPN